MSFHSFHYLSNRLSWWCIVCTNNMILTASFNKMFYLFQFGKHFQSKIDQLGFASATSGFFVWKTEKLSRNIHGYNFKCSERIKWKWFLRHNSTYISRFHSLHAFPTATMDRWSVKMNAQKFQNEKCERKTKKKNESSEFPPWEMAHSQMKWALSRSTLMKKKCNWKGWKKERMVLLPTR